MNISNLHIEGSTEIAGSAGSAPISAIAIPLLPPKGSWVITGVVQAVRSDGQSGPVTYYPRVSGRCANGIATSNTLSQMPTEPEDGGLAQDFDPGGLALMGDGQGLQLEIALMGVASGPSVAICWAWALDVLILATP